MQEYLDPLPVLQDLEGLPPLGHRHGMRDKRVRIDLAGPHHLQALLPFAMAATETAHSVRPKLRGKVVVCMSNALSKVGREFQPLVPPRGSVSASVQAELRDSYVAAAFHHVPATELGRIDCPVVSDILICSDHQRATVTISDLCSQIPGMRPLDAGELSNAMAIEAFTAVLLQLNVRYQTRVALQLAGINDDPHA